MNLGLGRVRFIAHRVRVPIAVLVVRFDDLTWEPNARRDPREPIVEGTWMPLYQTPHSA
jgi:hypothetical protein